MKITLQCVAILFLTLPCAAAEIHVSPAGNDANPGTSQQPLLTLDAARLAARKEPKSTVVVHGGAYRLEKTLRFGAEDSGQTWKAAAGEKPVLSGGIVVTGWTPDTAGRFKATVNLDNFRQLWVDGRRTQRARGKPPAGLKFWGKNEATVATYDNPPGLSGTPGYKPGRLDKIAPAGYTTTDARIAGWKNPGDMEFGFYSTWSHKIAKVEKITKTAEGATIEMSQPGFFLCNRAGGAVAKMPAYLENALELLDEPGEWYFDRPAQTLYYLPRAGEDLSKAEVIAPKLETLVEVKGARDIRFEGLTFAHATWLRPSTRLGHPDVQANFIQPPDNSYFRPEHEKGWVPVNGEQVKSAGNVCVIACRGLRFEGCTFTALGATGLDFDNGCQSNTVIGCRFNDISASAVQVGGISREDHHPGAPDRATKDNVVVNNVITRTGTDYLDAIGIFVGYTEGTVVAHNEISDGPYSGISCGWGWGMTDAGGGAYVDPIKWSTPTAAKNNRIEFNHIHHMMQRLNDGGAIYTLGRQPGTIIRGNHLHDCAGSPGGVYLDEGSANIEVAENAIYRVRRPLNFNNAKQNRRASCPVHDNYLAAPDKDPKAAEVAARAGLEPAYKDLLKDTATK